MPEQLGVVAQCAKNKYMNQCLRTPDVKVVSPEEIDEPIYLGNVGYQVTMRFTGARFLDATIVVTVAVTWDDIDEYNRRLKEEHQCGASK